MEIMQTSLLIFTFIFIPLHLVFTKMIFFSVHHVLDNKNKDRGSTFVSVVNNKSPLLVYVSLGGLLNMAKESKTKQSKCFNFLDKHFKSMPAIYSQFSYT